MAGREPTKAEKEAIRKLAQEGHTIDEIKEKFPDIDGRNISGVHRYVTQRMTEPTAETPRAVGTEGAEPVAAPEPAKLPSTARVPEVPRSPQEEAISTTGFTPAPAASNTVSQGFRPSYREYFVIKKLDQPDQGIVGQEYPPFEITSFIRKYKPGSYEIIHYREGRIFNTYREDISTSAKNNPVGANGEIKPDPTVPRPFDPGEHFIRSMDIYDQISKRREAEAAAARAAESAVKVEEVKVKAEEVKAKREMENAALVSLTSLATKALEPKTDPNAGSFEKVIALMQKEQESARERARTDLDMMRERAKLDAELERQKAAAEMERVRENNRLELDRQKADLAYREKMQQDFLAKMSQIESDRAALQKEILESNVQRLTDQQEAFSKELQEKKEWLDMQRKESLRHLDEIIALKKQIGGSNDSLEIGKLVVAGIDRIGARVDMLADKGVIPIGHPPGTQTKPKEVENKEHGVVNADKIKEVMKEKWFTDLQDEIYLVVSKRIKAGDNNLLKPHGSMLAQSFVTAMNEGDSRIRPYFHFLCAHEWPDILARTEEGIKEEYFEAFEHEEAVKWFTEFQQYLIAAWNASVGIK